MEVGKEILAKTLEGLKSKGFDYLKKITAVDYNTYLEVVYILFHTGTKEEKIITVKLDPKEADVDSIMHLYKAADWYERELSEMFGIRINNRDAKRLLLEEWDGTDAPLRKSFVWGKDYNKVD